MPLTLTGVFAPLATSFDDADQLDVRRWRVALQHWIATPLTGFVVLGTNGEAGAVDEREADAVVGEARAIIPGERPLIVGAGRESTVGTIDAVRRAAALGADAVLVRTPSLFKSQMTSDALIRHYTSVADVSPVPVLLYNFTALTDVNLAPSAVAALAAHPNIVGMKESGSDLAQISDLVTMTPPSFAVLAGSASTFYAALSAGAVGGILALAGLLPEQCVELFTLTRSGQYEAARDLQRRLLPVARMLSTGYGVPGLKAALRLCGVDAGVPRRPLSPAPADAVAALATALASFREIHV
jgi:4-hydroxy-2-oxoglutarate aldolase